MIPAPNDPNLNPTCCPFNNCEILGKHYYLMDLVNDLTYHHYAKPVAISQFNDVNDFAPPRLSP